MKVDGGVGWDLERVGAEARELEEMGTLVTDDMLDSFAIVEEPANVAGAFRARYGDIVDRTSAAYGGLPRDARAEIVRELTAA